MIGGKGGSVFAQLDFGELLIEQGDYKMYQAPRMLGVSQ